MKLVMSMIFRIFAFIVIYVIVNDSITTRMNDLLSLVGDRAFYKLFTISLKVA